jgi:protein arginine N-methyltransferase 1
MAEADGKLPAGTMEVEKTAKDYYFDSYSHFGIHEEMLKDYVRTDTYRRSIVDNKHLFKDKIVLDVGCGTGILSMFAAEAGAKHVYGVDCADIVKSARMIVEENEFSDRITIIQGKVEEIELPVKKVDIIISEWMGYFLLYESMMDTVLGARDKWLAKDGLLFPDKARMHICAIEDESYRRDKLDYWDNVYGFKMSCIKATAMAEPLVDVVPPTQIISSAQSICEIDLYTVKVEDLDFTADFEITFNRKDSCHGLTAWFDVQFSKCHVPVGFTTAPFADYTHWKQTVFYIKNPFHAEKDDVLKGRIEVKKNPNNHRDLNVALSLDFKGATQDQGYIMR